MKLAFFCAGSATQGMGHLLRCLALAQEVVSQQGSVLFCLDEVASKLAKSRSDWVGEIITVDDTFCATNFEHRSFSSEQLIDWVVVDAYHVQISFFRACKATQSKLLLFDDLHYQQALHWADVVVNVAVESVDDVPQYRAVKHITRFAVGSEYVLLRKEFTHISPKPFATRRYLTLCFGGSDPDNLTCEILKSLFIRYANVAFSLPIQVVTGPGYQYLNELETVLTLFRGKVEIVHRHNVQTMAEIWNDTRLAISAGGGAQFELKACRTPSILVVVAENQRQASLASQREGWCKTLVYHNELAKFKEHLLDSLDLLLQNPNILKNMSDYTRKSKRSLGAPQLLNLLKLSPKEEAQ
jgi:UDP-2,4-diacetamido-2,4,6-trideoxy-beta-L-altropyranose hydrolase